MRGRLCLTPNEGIAAMLKLRAGIIASGVATASYGLATAADLPPAPTLPRESPPGVEFGGWYLRGDVGVGLTFGSPNLQIIPDPIATGISSGLLSDAAQQSFNDSTLSSSGVIDFGLGYQFNEWFRLDGTIEYRKGANLGSLDVLTDPNNPVLGGPARFAAFYRANVASFVGLINGYVNLGSWWGVSPFIGAGAGVAENNGSGFAGRGVNLGGFVDLGPSGESFSNGVRTNFSWALMAGLDVNVSPNVKIEFGYRYLDYGRIATGRSNCLAGSIEGTVASLTCAEGASNLISSRSRLASNDLRVGIIWLLGEAASATPAAIAVKN